MKLICGILRLDAGEATSEDLERMARAMTPDGLAPDVQHYLDGPMGLCVLAFNETGTPLLQRDGWVVAADIRCNRADAGEDVLLSALHSHGADFPDHIDGDFAAAIWRRDSGHLWLGRDYIGVRPLVWTWQPGRWFAFASLPSGLLKSGMASHVLDPVAIGCKMAYQYFTGADSGYAEIAFLEAGHSLRVHAHDAAPPCPHRAYKPALASVGSWHGTPEQAAETLSLLVQEAVQARLPARGPVACHLTGGLDSSAITVLAARELRRRGQQLAALTMMAATATGPDELNERPLIEAVLQQESDVKHVRVHDRPVMPDAPEDLDWPGAYIGGTDDEMFAAAAAAGVGMLLSGVGGDEGASYNGANLYATLLRQGQLRHLIRELPARARSDGVPVHKAILHRLVLPLMPSLLSRIRHNPGVLHRTQGTARYLGRAIVDQVLQRRLPAILQTNTHAERLLAFADHHIPSRCAFYAMLAARHGLAVSFPLLDRRVVDFVLSLPAFMFLADGQSRQPFRRAMRGVLPEKVRLAKYKVGVFDELFIRYASIKPQLLALLASLRTEASVVDVFDLDAIENTIEQLPTHEQAASQVRSRPGANLGSQPPWRIFLAINMLMGACWVARMSAQKQ